MFFVKGSVSLNSLVFQVWILQVFNCTRELAQNVCICFCIFRNDFIPFSQWNFLRGFIFSVHDGSPEFPFLFLSSQVKRLIPFSFLQKSQKFLREANPSGALKYIPRNFSRPYAQGLIFSFGNLDNKCPLNVSLEKLL